MTLAALVLLALAAGPAAAPSPEVRARVDELLGALHGPVPAEAFRALGPGAEEALADVARGGGMPSRRIHALEALASLGGARAEETHRAVAASEAPSVVRRRAIRGLGRLAGPARAAGALSPFLAADGDPAVRAAAAEALAEVAPEEGCGAVRTRARAEPARDRRRFARALSACDRARDGTPPSR